MIFLSPYTSLSLSAEGSFFLFSFAFARSFSFLPKKEKDFFTYVLIDLLLMMIKKRANAYILWSFRLIILFIAANFLVFCFACIQMFQQLHTEMTTIAVFHDNVLTKADDSMFFPEYSPTKDVAS